MKTILIYSGGLDSTVALYSLRKQGHEVKALSVDYGQRHKKEIEVARKICQELDVEHRVADLTSVTSLLGSSSQTNMEIDVPEGHYEEESMKATVVPNRNMIMLSIAFGWAITMRADYVAYGAHAGDHAIYPDCRPDFVAALAEAVKLADWHSVSLLAPFLGMTKADIVMHGGMLGVPMWETWSCYKGGAVHCGKCGTCMERREAFARGGVRDRTIYEGE